MLLKLNNNHLIITKLEFYRIIIKIKIKTRKLYWLWFIKNCFQIWNKKEHNIISRVINSHMRIEPDIGLAVRVFANSPGDLGSIPDRIIPKTQKMVLDASLLNTQHYKARIKGKVEQSRERSSALPYTLV